MSDIGTARALVDKIRQDIAAKPDVDDLLVEGRLLFEESAAWAFVCGVLEERLKHCDHMLVRLTSLLRDLEVEALEQIIFQEEGLS